MSTRHLARTAAVSDCPTAIHAAVAGIDLDLLLQGTAFHEPARVPASARQRGARFERLLAENDHRRLRQVLTAHLDLGAAETLVVRDLRHGFGDGPDGHSVRAAETSRLLQQMATGDPNAPTILVGPILTYQLGPNLRYAEADFIVIAAGRLIIVEAKAHPVVDGTVLGGPQTGWRFQIGMYAWTVSVLLEAHSHPPSIVADYALLILPDGMGLQPTVRQLNIANDRTLAALTVERIGAGR